MIGVEDKDNPYYCPSCKYQHKPYPNTRIKVVVSDSTLHNFFAPSSRSGSALYPGDVHHVDYVTIPGADINSRAKRLVIKPENRKLRDEGW